MIHYANAANIVLATFILHNVITMTQQLIIGAAILYERKVIVISFDNLLVYEYIT